MKVCVTHAYLDFNIVAVRTQLMSIMSLIKKRQWNCICSSSTHSINEAILYLRNNDCDYVNEEVRKDVNGQINVSVNPILYSPSVKIHLPLKFLFIP
jgi:hypothetical protein